VSDKRSVTHATFVIERTYPASPERVFRAFADPAIKARWFGGKDDWSGPETAFDFRVGGRERHQGRLHNEPELHTFDGTYWDIVPDKRIVFAYDMHLDDTRISVSLATVELAPAGGGTQLVFTEQGAFLDGYDIPTAREEGTKELLNALGAELDRQAKEEA
jgi:uncharacterized protein YndB with AHSA1/START domain